jgi:predicted membrane-bound spermidine synthase
VLEVSLTRVFSFIMFHHMTYLVISVALLGFGAASSALTIRGDAETRGGTEDFVARNAWRFGLGTVAAIVVIPRIRFYPEDMILRGDYSHFFSLLIVLVLAGIPFYFAGLCVGHILSRAGERINRVYFSDLIGAALGSLTSLLVISHLGGTAACFAVAALTMLVAIVSGARHRVRYAVACLVLAALTPFVARTNVLPLYAPPDKPLFRNEDTIEHTEWHPITRIDVTRVLHRHHSYGGALSWDYSGPAPPQRVIYQDGGALTGIIQPNGQPEATPVLGHYMQGSAFVIRPHAQALVIGCGGGVDVMIALHHRARHVVGVDINPKTIDLVRTKYADFARGTFQREDVELVVSEGRHFLTKDDRRFDVIQLSGVDTFTALAAGAYALTEYYIYTREAMDQYLAHLEPDGIVGFSRPLLKQPRETAKLIITAVEALEAIGTRRPADHFVILSARGKGTYFAMPWGQVMIKRSPFTRQEVERLTRWATAHDFHVAYEPFGNRVDSQLAPFVRSGPEERGRIMEDYVFDLTPATDDRPFFFQYYRWDDFWKLKWLRGEGPVITMGAIVLLASFVQVLILSALFVLYPLYRKVPAARKGGRTGIFVYFAALGLGFIVIEVALLQKFTVFLGGPAYSMAITLFAILLSSGFGALASKSFSASPLRTVSVVIPLLAVAVLVESVALDGWIERLMDLPRSGRCAAAAGFVFPLGFLMGMPFPSGLRLVHRVRPELSPWSWGINACATVMGSVVTMMLSTTLGFNRAMQIGAVVYLVGWLIFLFSRGRRSGEAPSSA